jgi:hypothetical protein
MRRFKKQLVYPVVELGHTFMGTNFGGRERPELVVKRWITLGPDGTGTLPAPDAPRITGPAAATAPTASTAAHIDMQTVKPPSLREEIDDEIKF